MPDLALALLALAPPTDSGVWLDAPPKPGTVVTRPVVVTGETQALEGVLGVALYVVRDGRATVVDSFAPTLPVGPIPFELTWDPAGARPGRVTIRVVATTLTRGFSAEVPGLVVPRAQAAPTDVRPVVRPVVAPGPAPARPARPVPAAPRLDDSGRAFGEAAPTLPYVRYYDNAPTPPPTRPTIAAPVPLLADRSAWASVAGGLLLLVFCAHLHRVLLRWQPDPRDG